MAVEKNQAVTNRQYPISSEPEIRSQATTVSFNEAFRFWVKLGFISFGGPAGQIAIMHRELVERRRWVSEERFLHALNYCMLLPGPEAQQLAIYIGWLLHRTWGGIVAGALFVIPSIFVLLALSYVYAAHGNIPAVAGVLSGFKPIVVAIVVEAVIKIGGRALKRWAHFVIAGWSFISIYFQQIPFPVIVLVAAIVGLLGARYLPKIFAAAAPIKEADRKTEGEGELTQAVPLLIDDHAPPPDHTLPNRLRTFKILAVGLALWIVPLIVLTIGVVGKPPCPGIPFLHSGCSGYFRRRVRCAGLCHASGRRIIRLDNKNAGSRRTGAGRDHARTFDHGASVRGLHGSVEPPSRYEPECQRHNRSTCHHLRHVSALFPFHLSWRTLY